MDVLDLVAKLKIDTSDYISGLTGAAKSASTHGSSMANTFGRMTASVGSAMATVTKVTAAAVGVAATGIATITTKAIENYAEYEQLVGGIETLFTPSQSMDEFVAELESIGVSAEEAASRYSEGVDKVMTNASNAWKTAGVDANTYMNQAVSMSATLIQGLGGDTSAAADLVDVAITDMSDNVNKMGTTMEAVQNAYRGLSMQNYKMLDNLKLGYQGTSAEMARLINDSGVMGDTFVATADNIKDISYDKYIEAIHEIQTQMGITGTTALEASTTIQGSANQMKAAWSNLLTGIADDNADIEVLMQNLVDSVVGYTDEAGNEVGGFVDNILPVIETSLSSIGTLIQELVPSALSILDTLLAEELPKLSKTAIDLVTGIVTTISTNLENGFSAFSDVFDTLVDAFGTIMPSMISIAGDVVTYIANGISDNKEAIINAIIETGTTIITTFTSVAPLLLDVGLELMESFITGIGNSLPEVITSVAQLVVDITTVLVDHVPDLISAGITIFTGLVEGITQAIPIIVSALPELISSIVEVLINAVPTLLSAALTLFTALVDALPTILASLKASLPEIISSVVTVLVAGIPTLLEAAIEFFMAIIDAIPDIIDLLVDMIPDIVTAVIEALLDATPELLEAAIEFFNALCEAIPDIINALIDAVPEIVNSLVAFFTGDGFTQLLAASVKLFMALVQAIPQIMSSLTSALGSMLNTLASDLQGNQSKMMAAAIQMLQGIIMAIIQLQGTITAAVAQLLVEMLAKVKEKVADWITVGGNLLDGLKQGFMNKLEGVKTAIANGATSIANAAKAALGISSPSKVFSAIGVWCAEGLEDGWDKEIDAVNKKINDDMKYDADLSVTTSLNNTVSTTAHTRLLSDEDITRLAEALTINFTNTTNIDGTEIEKKTYKYTVQRVGDETKAYSIAQGGY